MVDRAPKNAPPPRTASRKAGKPTASSASSAVSIAPPGGPILTAHPPSAPEITFLEWFEYFPYVPAALAVKECVRLKRMKELPIVGPVLDVGCGDGLFTSIVAPEVDAWGIDINEREAARAQASKSYRHVLCQSITETDSLPHDFFKTCVANCSLEHVPDIRAALKTIHASMRKGGLFYLIVPKSNWTDTLPLKRALKKIGLGDLGRAYGAALDAQFAHHHLYDEAEWIALLEEAGFDSIEHEPLGSYGSQTAFEATLIPSLMGYLTKKITGHWVVAPQTRRLYAWPVFQVVRWLMARDRMEGKEAEILLVCRAA